jgi:uncharacterized protein (DUF2062 family)
MVTMFPSALQLLPEFFRTAPLTKLIPSQMNADEKFLFRICVSRRDLRASPDSVAAGRAVPLRGNFMFLPPVLPFHYQMAQFIQLLTRQRPKAATCCWFVAFHVAS